MGSGVVVDLAGAVVAADRMHPVVAARRAVEDRMAVVDRRAVVRRAAVVDRRLAVVVRTDTQGAARLTGEDLVRGAPQERALDEAYPWG